MRATLAGAILSQEIPASPPRQVAAVDLGSNSFHMVVAEATGSGDFRILDRIRHRVRLAGGLGEHRLLAPDAQARALDSLAKMGQRLQGFDPDDVRAVGTNTFRKARNGLPFLVRCGAALGHRIDIISGREEARLVFAGVQHGLPDQRRSFVVDIGGGSTEVIVGEESGPLLLDSLFMGCVSHSERFFPGGKLSKSRFKAARVSASLELAPISRSYRELGWERAVGSSGTVRALAAMLRENQITDGSITKVGLQVLERRLIEAGHIDRLRVPGLSEMRRPVIAGGLAILRAVIDSFGMHSIRPSDSALREGVLLDLLGRGSAQDRRAHAVSAFAQQFGVDTGHAGRVEETALTLFDAIDPSWALSAALPEARRFVSWAAQVHEAGLALRWQGYHKHSAYLVANGDLPGFTRPEQSLLAALVLGHRGRLSATRLQAVSDSPIALLFRLCIPLRLAHRFQRQRGSGLSAPSVVSVDRDHLTLRLPGGPKDHPLTQADLLEEARVLEGVGVRLVLQQG
jgi:exopolyphosphatase/guanosine-5'-triphosphate,3'-diphosphate pyrophosphatase